MCALHKVTLFLCINLQCLKWPVILVWLQFNQTPWNTVKLKVLSLHFLEHNHCCCFNFQHYRKKKYALSIFIFYNDCRFVWNISTSELCFFQMVTGVSGVTIHVAAQLVDKDYRSDPVNVMILNLVLVVSLAKETLRKFSIVMNKIHVLLNKVDFDCAFLFLDWHIVHYNTKFNVCTL